MPNTHQTLSITAEILGLTGVEVTKIELNRNDQFIITVVSTKKEIPCHQCAQLTEPHGKGRTIRLRHLYILGRQTFIEITPPRGRCANCDKNPTTTQSAN
jgi:transposase